MTISYCLIWDSPNLEGQVLVFISPRNRVTKLYPEALGFLFVTSHDSQDYGGGILTCLHTGKQSMFKFKFKLYCDWWSVNQLILVSDPLWGPWPDFNFLFWQFFSSCRMPSPTRGWVCNLQCSHSLVRVAQDPYPYVTVSSETPPSWRARSPYLYPPGTGWPSYTPRHWVPFMSSLTTCSATAWEILQFNEQGALWMLMNSIVFGLFRSLGTNIKN
jgi:hypothetical protein